MKKVEPSQAQLNLALPLSAQPLPKNLNKFAGMSLLDLWKEVAKIRRRTYAMRMAYDAEQERKKKA